MAYLSLKFLGGFEALWPSGQPVVLPTKKAKAILAYCALRPGQVFQRDSLATLLWGDREDNKARNSLRQTLFVLRTALREGGCPALRIDGDTVAIDPAAIDLDVLRFERLASEQTPAALEEAAALYRGDLLEGFIVDEEPFEQWLLVERERLRDLALEVLARLLRHEEGAGMTAAAVQTARRLLVLDPLQEPVHRILMRLLAGAGRREAALRQYEVCVGLLRRELRLQPEVATQQLYERIVSGPWPAPAPRLIPEAGARPIYDRGSVPAVAGTASNVEGAPPGTAGGAEPLRTTSPALAPSLDKARARVSQISKVRERAFQLLYETLQAANARAVLTRELRRINADRRALLRSAVRETRETVLAVKRSSETLLPAGGATAIPATGGPVRGASLKDAHPQG